MRIGLLTQYYKPEMGAPQNRLYEMVRGLKELGNDMYIITAMPNYPTGKIFDAYKGKIICNYNSSLSVGNASDSATIHQLFDLII